MRRVACAFGIALAVLGLDRSAFTQAPRDLILVHGHVYTADGSRPRVSAFSILDGRIMEVGSDEDVLGAAKAGTRVFDLNGRTVVPGFIDAHGHLLGLGASLREFNVTGTTSYDAIVKAVAARAESASPGEWILGRGWDQNDWPDTAFPDHGPLSTVSPDNPVVLGRVDGHALLVNRVALDSARITDTTPDPSGGKIIRDAEGHATGVLIDRAQELVRRHIPKSTDRYARETLQRAVSECLRHGVTSVHDAGVSGETIELYRRMIDEGAFNLRVYAMLSAADIPALDAYFERGPLIGYGDGRLTVRCVKARADGALGSRGAALFDPYTDDPGNRGLLLLSEDEIRALTGRALRAGFQVAVHAIGDRANHTVLDAYAGALDAVGMKRENNDARLRIEHAQVVALEDIPRFAAMRVIPSMQTTHATSDMYWALKRLGPERIKGAYAWQRFIKEGSRIANGSDFPVEPVNPLLGFYAAITRQDTKGWPKGGWYPEQRMTRRQALRSFTIDAAYAAFEEDEKGSIETGKLADVVILDRDIMEIPPAEILDTRVVMTLLGGKVVFATETL